MKTTKWWSAALWFVVAVVAARAAEERVELGGELNGRWLEPTAGWDGRAVLILHGFASDSEGPMDCQRRLAEALAARGIASLRINYRGEGDAARTELASTFATRVEDTETARAWVAARPGVAAGRIGALGFSLGGGTALAVAGRHPEWFRAVVLWSSVTGDLHASFTGWAPVREQGVEARAEREGVAPMEIAGWKTVTLRREFFASLRGVDLDAELGRYPGALLSVRGMEDFLPVREPELLRIAKGRPAEAVLIAGGDHVFNVFDPGAPQFGQAVEATVAWLVRVL